VVKKSFREGDHSLPLSRGGGASSGGKWEAEIREVKPNYCKVVIWGKTKLTRGAKRSPQKKKTGMEWMIEEKDLVDGQGKRVPLGPKNVPWRYEKWKGGEGNTTRSRRKARRLEKKKKDGGAKTKDTNWMRRLKVEQVEGENTGYPREHGKRLGTFL